MTPSTPSDELVIAMIGAEWPSARPGGLNRYFLDLYQALAVDGAGRVHAVAFEELRTSRGGSMGKAISASGRMIRAGVRSIAALRGADVVDVHFALYGIVASLLRGRRPLVVHFHGPWAAESALAEGRRVRSGRTRLKRLLERWLYCRADAVVTLSQAFADLLAREYGVSPSKIVVIPPGVDLERFQLGDRRKARESLDVDDTAFLVVVARRIEERMGIDVLLRAWQMLEVPGSVLLIAGEGSRLGALRRASESGPRAGSVQWLGRVDEQTLVRLYQAADCTVVPTRALEGFGLVVLESVACGTPAIVTNIGGLPEAVGELDPTLIVPSEDHESLTRRMHLLAEGKRPDAKACRAYAETFTWSRAAEHHRCLYRKLLCR